MKRYAVALISFFDNDNKVFIVESETKQKAMLKALSLFNSESDEETTDKNVLEWIRNMEEKTVEEIQEEVFNADISISEPVEI